MFFMNEIFCSAQKDECGKICGVNEMPEVKAECGGVIHEWTCGGNFPIPKEISVKKNIQKVSSPVSKAESYYFTKCNTGTVSFPPACTGYTLIVNEPNACIDESKIPPRFPIVKKLSECNKAKSASIKSSSRIKCNLH